MSFKCSVFGHRFGDPEVEREREEQGSEVVITITETETCKRCGEQRVVSENKEVTTLETPSDIVGDDLEDDETEAEPAAAETEPESEPAPETTDDAEFIDDGDDAVEDEGGVEPASAETTVPDAEAADPTAWPEEDEPAPDEDDAVILDEDEEGEDDDGRAPGEWPQEDDADDADDWAPETSTDLPSVEDEQPDVQPTSAAVTVPDGQFYCPECEFTTDVEASSLREGDFCPECHRGSLTHRSGEE